MKLSIKDNYIGNTKLIRILKTAFFVLAVCSIMHAQNNKGKIIILDFEISDMEEAEGKILSDRFRSEIVKTKLFSIDDRKESILAMMQAAKEQGGCVTTNCTEKWGKMLGAQFVISGSITQIGETYTVKADLFSVSTAQTERSKGSNYNGPVEGMLTVMEVLAWEIMGLDPPPLLKARLSGINTSEMFTISVMDFSGNGIIQMEAEALSDEFGKEVEKTGMVAMISRDVAKNILMESKGWGGFTACMARNCAMETGALIGAQYVVGGSISKNGNSYDILLRLFSVVTGAEKATREVTYRGPVDGLVVEIRILAWDMMGLKPPRSLTSSRKGKIVGPGLMEILQSPRYKPMVLSTFIPGLGQYSVGNLNSARWYFGSVLFAAGMVAYNYSEYDGAYKWSDELYYDNYLLQNNSVDMLAYEEKVRRAVKDVEWHNDQMKLFAGISVTAWLMNIMNANTLGKPLAEELPWLTALNPNMGIDYKPELNAPVLTLSIDLPSR